NQNVDQGKTLVGAAGQVIDDVTAHVEAMNEQIGVIAIASREQANGVEGVNKALVQLQGATQHSASIVQEAAFSAVRLKEEALRLFELVGQFQVDESGPDSPLSAHGRTASAPAPLPRSPGPAGTTRLLSR
ncbi:MAG TPA: hypothetical protein VF386_12660, partial [Usitatibacter sp.]